MDLGHRVRDLAPHERAGHVRPATRRLVARPEVDLDRRVGGERTRAGIVPDVRVGSHRLDHDVGRGRRAGALAHLADPGPHRLAGQPLAVSPQLLAADLGLPEHGGGGAQGIEAGGRGAADAGHLGGGLVAPALGERPGVGDELDPGRTQAIGDPDRELRRDDRVADAQPLDRADAQLLLDLERRAAVGDQLVAAEVFVQQALEVGGVAGDSPVLERVGDHHAPAVGFEVQERIADRDRHLVTELRPAVRVAPDQQVHGVKLATGPGGRGCWGLSGGHIPALGPPARVNAGSAPYVGHIPALDDRLSSSAGL